MLSKTSQNGCALTLIADKNGLIFEEGITERHGTVFASVRTEFCRSAINEINSRYDY